MPLDSNSPSSTRRPGREHAAALAARSAARRPNPPLAAHEMTQEFDRAGGPVPSLLPRGRTPLPGCPAARCARSLVRASSGWQREEGLCPPASTSPRGRGATRHLRPHLPQRVPTNPADAAARRGRRPVAGRGVTIAFLTSGFYPHPALTAPADRVLHYVNIVARGPTRGRTREFRTPNASELARMMTWSSRRANGYLSAASTAGWRPRPASCSSKWATALASTTTTIAAVSTGWSPREEFDIRVVNVSCGGDYEASLPHDALSQAAEAAVRAGLVVVCAAGN